MYQFNFRGHTINVSEQFSSCANEQMLKVHEPAWKKLVLQFLPPKDFITLHTEEKVLFVILNNCSQSVYYQIMSGQSVGFNLNAVSLKTVKKVIRRWTGQDTTVAQLRESVDSLVALGLIKSHLGNPTTRMIVDLKYYPTIKTLKLFESVWQHYMQSSPAIGTLKN